MLQGFCLLCVLLALQQHFTIASETMQSTAKLPVNTAFKGSLAAVPGVKCKEQIASLGGDEAFSYDQFFDS